MKITTLTIILCLFTHLGFSQSDTSSKIIDTGIFDRIASSVKNFQLDTSAVPDDRVTKKIVELRSLRGGFNINEAIEFKIAEDRQKNEVPSAELDRFARFFSSGEGKRWLDNAMVWIYRKDFTYNELKKMVKFYKTSAGQKMAKDFPVIMMQSLRAAEMIKEIYARSQKS